MSTSPFDWILGIPDDMREASNELNRDETPDNYVALMTAIARNVEPGDAAVVEDFAARLRTAGEDMKTAERVIEEFIQWSKWINAKRTDKTETRDMAKSESLVKSAERVARNSRAAGEQTWADLQEYNERKLRRRQLVAILVLSLATALGSGLMYFFVKGG